MEKSAASGTSGAADFFVEKAAVVGTKTRLSGRPCGTYIDLKKPLFTPREPP
jgi:hypothetical protein